MDKRQFLGAAALAGMAPAHGHVLARPGKGPFPLTITGAIGRPNRGHSTQRSIK